MKNLKLRHFIPIFGVDKMDQTTPKEEFILLIYNLVILTVISIVGTALIFKYLV